MDHDDEIEKIEVLLLDGGLGTTLGAEPYSVTYDDQTPLWSSHLLLSAPTTLVSAHQDFLVAGADIILSATYQASYEGFARTPRVNSGTAKGYNNDEAAGHMRNAINLVAHAISRRTSTSKTPAIALSLGAYGAILSPSQEFSGCYPAKMASEHALATWHRERLDIFRSDQAVWDQISYVAFETVRPTAEIRGIRKAACGIDKKWWISHVLPDEVHASDIPAVITATLSSEEGLAVPWGIGVNCTAVHKVRDVEREYRDTMRTKFPDLVRKLWFVLYPDGTRGEVYDTTAMRWVKTTSEHNLQKPWDDLIMEVVVSAAASKAWKGIVVGGCCKTLPQDIKQLRSRIDSLEELQR